MDLTVDIQDIPVAPEYPVTGVYETQTYFPNERRIQLIEEVRNGNLTVEEFMAMYEGEPHNGDGTPEMKPEATEPDHRANSESEKNTAEPIVRPHADHELVVGVDVFNLFFPQGHAALNEAQFAKLETLPANKCFRVAGFASPEGSAKLNLRLSEERAESVAAAIEKTGREVLAHGGLGEYSAHIWPGPWPEARRVEIYSQACE